MKFTEFRTRIIFYLIPVSLLEYFLLNFFERSFSYKMDFTLKEDEIRTFYKSVDSCIPWENRERKIQAEKKKRNLKTYYKRIPAPNFRPLMVIPAELSQVVSKIKAKRIDDFFSKSQTKNFNTYISKDIHETGFFSSETFQYIQFPFFSSQFSIVI